MKTGAETGAGVGQGAAKAVSAAGGKGKPSNAKGVADSKIDAPDHGRGHEQGWFTLLLCSLLEL